jgi:OOP family OmpA-OmpF porin
MTKQYAKLIRKAGAMLLGATAALACAPAAHAQPSGTSAYVTDAHGSAIRNANYLCWHTGFWTPAAAIADCDPDLVARPAPPTAKKGSAAKQPEANSKGGASRAKSRRSETEAAETGR